MKTTYTSVIARKILLVFLVITIFFSIAALIIRTHITKKLEDISKITINADRRRSKPAQALLLLRQAEDDFQESLVEANNKKSIEFKENLSRAFNNIDTLLREATDTALLTPVQRNRVRLWYQKKLNLSDKLYVLKHNFDTLLTVYADFNKNNESNLHKFNVYYHAHKKSGESKNDTIRRIVPVEKKGLLKRLKEAIANKKGNATIEEINHNNDTSIPDLDIQKIVAKDKNDNVKKLRTLQQQNEKLLSMQRELIFLNSHINNELERIINDVKDINFNMLDEFKEAALKNYQETNILLNRFYLTALFFVLAFAILLIIFILKLNKSELLLRKENEQSVTAAQRKIDELMSKIVLTERNQSATRIEELKEIVQLAVSNNPAFLMKYNEFDTEFSKKLLCIAPNLVATEIEFCVLLRLNFETKEIARFTKISVRAVEGKKHRVRKKLGIPSDQDINLWMTKV